MKIKLFKFQIFFLKNYTKKAHQSIFCFFFLCSHLLTGGWEKLKKKRKIWKENRQTKLHSLQNCIPMKMRPKVEIKKKIHLSMSLSRIMSFFCAFIIILAKKKKNLQPQKYIFSFKLYSHYLFCLIKKKKAFQIKSKYKFYLIQTFITKIKK